MTRTMLLAATLLIAPLVSVAGATDGTVTAASAKAHGAIQGSWVVLGPASGASFPLMLEFAFQESPPTAEQMTAVFLTPAEQEQVRVARRKVAADPTGAEVVEMRATLAALDASRIEINATELTALSTEGEARLTYSVVRSEGLTLTVRTADASGTEAELLLALPAPGLMMMGPPGAEPLVLRRR